MPNLILTNIQIGDRNFRVKVSPEEEGMVQQVAEKINLKIEELKSTYGGKDMQDFLSMAILSFMVDNQLFMPADSSENPALDRLERMIDQAL